MGSEEMAKPSRRPGTLGQLVKIPELRTRCPEASFRQASGRSENCAHSWGDRPRPGAHTRSQIALYIRRAPDPDASEATPAPPGQRPGAGARAAPMRLGTGSSPSSLPVKRGYPEAVTRVGTHGTSVPNGPSRSGKLLVFSTWMPAVWSPLNGVGPPGHPADAPSSGELNHNPR